MRSFQALALFGISVSCLFRAGHTMEPADSPPTTTSALVAPVAVKPLEPLLSPAVVEQQRIQQLYQLALAERLRMASGLAWPRLDAPTAAPHPPLLPPVHSYMYPWRLMDPRTLYRVPEEPKPQHSYIGLIAMAILSSPDKKLVLSDIYSYILDNYAYFRTRGPGWRNSIRHNLSLNDCFMKSGRSANGKGHYWAIHPANIDDFARGDFRRRRAQRRVRKHMGLQVDDDSSPEPPPPSPPSMPLIKDPLRTVAPTRKRQFDVASLLAPDDRSLKSRKFGSPSPPPLRTSPDPPVEGQGGSLGLDEARHWPLLGWTPAHSWTLLTPPQEEQETPTESSSAGATPSTGEQ